MCASNALSLVEAPVPAAGGKGPKKHVLFDSARCIGCGACFLACKTEALSINWQTNVAEFLERMVEYAAAILLARSKPSLHISFVTNVTPDCDCMGFSDACICPDVGVLASLDPVAIDQASIDLINKAEPLWPSHLPKGLKPGDDKFLALRPHLPPAMGLDYAEALGLGTREYELVAL